jgi:hypothetical protein
LPILETTLVSALIATLTTALITTLLTTLAADLLILITGIEILVFRAIKTDLIPNLDIGTAAILILPDTATLIPAVTDSIPIIPITAPITAPITLMETHTGVTAGQ